MTSPLAPVALAVLVSSLASACFALQVAPARGTTPPLLAEPIRVDGHTLAVPTPQQAAWQALGVGMFIHMAPQTWQDSETDTMATPASAMNPEKLDTEQWVNVAESMGAKYIVFVAKHEGGFCWWPTTTTDYNVSNTPFKGGKGDVLAMLAESCRKHKMKLGVYISPQDKKHNIGVGGKAADATKQAEYETLFRTQLTEVLSRYGEMMEVWFDGSLIFDVGDILTKHAPNAMVFQGPQATIRWVGNESGIVAGPAWNAVKLGKQKWGDYTGADGDPTGDRWLPNEVDARIRATWFWQTDNHATLKSLDALVEMYETSVGRGGVLLLNNTPDRSGLIPEADAKRAAEFGAEIKRRYGVPTIDTSGSGPVHTLTLSAPAELDRVIISEDITKGERIRKYVIEAQAPGAAATEWKQLAAGTAVGAKRIERFAPTKVSKLRLRIIESVGEPKVSTFAAFQAGT